MDDLDCKIKKSYTEAEKAIKVDPDVAYERFMVKLKKQENEKKSWLEQFISSYYRGLITAGLIVSFIMGNIFTESVTAVGSKLKEYWYSTTGGFSQKNININTKTPPLNITQEEFTKIEDLKARVSFIMHDIGYIPSGIKVNKLSLQQIGSRQKATIEYSGQNKTISFTQWLLTEESSSFTNIDSNNSEVRNFNFRDKNYDIVVFKNGDISCKYIDLQLETALFTSGISYEEFTKILVSIE